MPKKQLKLKPVYELLCTSDFRNCCTLTRKTLTSFLMVFDMFNEKKNRVVHPTFRESC